MFFFDPAAPDLSMIPIDQEISVDDIAQMQDYETVLDTEFTAQIEAAAIATTPTKPIDAPILPVPIASARKRLVSGRYNSCLNPWQLVLRVDIDGRSSTRRISGDYFYKSGNATTYFGSFVLDALSITVSDTMVTVTGTANMTWKSSFNKLQVRIPRHTSMMPPATAYAQWLTADNKRGASYTCTYESAYLRTIELEEDYEKGVTRFTSYNTGDLPSGGSSRALSVAGAYAEAGIEMRPTGATNQLNTAPGGTWSDSELHNAIETHFSRWSNEPAWKVWLLHAQEHDFGPNLLGIMFDQKDRQRQGCATFYKSLAGNNPAALRSQLYTHIHELGHCFNLFHSFHKEYTDPPLPNRPTSLSWMNYPQRFPEGGAVGFWSKFPFAFDRQELIHLRHGFYKNIVMGGHDFGDGAALGSLAHMNDHVESSDNLRLDLTVRECVLYGEPIYVGLQLSKVGTADEAVHTELDPSMEFVQIAIEKPNGEIMMYAPPIEHFVRPNFVTLSDEQPAVFDSAYIGYDKDGLVFTAPGIYKLRGIYHGIDGSSTLSAEVKLRVQPPYNAEEEEIANLLMGDEQGMLIYLGGSDSKFLAEGNQALEQLITDHQDHPLAVYAQLTQGINSARDFKSIKEDKSVEVRPANPKDAIGLIQSAINGSVGEEGVDDITLTLHEFACQNTNECRNNKAANKTIKQMVDIFESKDIDTDFLQVVHNNASLLTDEMQDN